MHFHEVPKSLMHTVHANRACTTCGKHFIIDSELEAMCGPAPITVQYTPSSVATAVPVAAAVPADPKNPVPAAKVGP